MKRILKIDDGKMPNNILYSVEIVKELPKHLKIHNTKGEEIYKGFEIKETGEIIDSFYQLDMETNAVLSKIDIEIKKLKQKKIKLLQNTHRFKLHTNK